ncbi:DUF4189 domain-containing protein [Luteibacter sp.]|uniref:DUF4189 domain-containing protein n=1 Tax=Luteibacter sp. TaxID=1886636 RepID=UPI003F7DD4B6
MLRMNVLFASVTLMAVVSAHAATQKPAPAVPQEVAAEAPAGSTLLAFASSGSQPNATAAAVFQGAATKNDARYRTLIVFAKRDGRFTPEFSSDKILGCSKCTQFHDDPFWPDGINVKPSRITINQGDGGETPSVTSIRLVRRGDAWTVESATREVVRGGRGDAKTEDIALPASRLAKDLDAGWVVPVFYNTIVVNNTTGRFIFRHRTPTPDGVWDEVRGRCNKQECSILVQQKDGCISLVQDASAKSFGAGTPDEGNERAASAKAMAACQAAGGQQCKVVRTDCARGI